MPRLPFDKSSLAGLPESPGVYLFLDQDGRMLYAGKAVPLKEVQNSRAALDAGYGNVLMLPPFYYKNVSDDGLFAAYARTIEGVGARALRVRYSCR